MTGREEYEPELYDEPLGCEPLLLLLRLGWYDDDVVDDGLVAL